MHPSGISPTSVPRHIKEYREKTTQVVDLFSVIDGVRLRLTARATS